MPVNREFGDLLTQGLKSIDAKENRTLALLQFELANELGLTEYAVQAWRQGQIPKDPSAVSYLAEECVSRGGCDDRWLRRFLETGRHPQPERIVQKLFPEGDLFRSNYRDNLPSVKHQKFVGRQDKLAELKHYLSRRHRLPIVCISGLGGVGKTALALEVAHNYYANYGQLPPEERFEAIVFVSAKKFELHPAGRRPTLSNKLTDLDSVFRELSIVLEMQGIFAGDDNAKRQAIAYAVMKKRRTLLILDNMEDVNDPYILSFLYDLPAPSKGLITSRNRVDVAVPIELTGLAPESARELAMVEAERRDITLTRKQAEEIAEKTGGMPLAIVRVLAKMAWRKTRLSTELDLLRDLSDDYWDHIFGEPMRSIRGTDAHELFMSMALFPTGATRDAIGYVAGLSENTNRRDNAFGELHELSLVEQTEDHRLALNQPTLAFAGNELKHHHDFELKARKNRIEWYKHWCKSVEKLDPEIRKDELPNIIALMSTLWERQEMKDLIWFFGCTHDSLNAFGYWESRKSFVNVIVDWAVSRDNWSLVVEYFPRYITSLHTWIRLDQDGPDWIHKGNTWADLIDDHNLEQKLRAHIQYCELRILRAKLLHDPMLLNTPHRMEAIQKSMVLTDRIYPIYKKHGLPIFLMSTLYDMGNVLSDEEMYQEAVAYYDKALELLEDFPDEEISKDKWRAVIDLGKAITEARQGDYKGACEVIKRRLSRLVHREDLAMAYSALAFYERKLGNYESAKTYLRNVRDLREQYRVPVPVSLEERWCSDAGV